MAYTGRHLVGARQIRTRVQRDALLATSVHASVDRSPSLIAMVAGSLLHCVTIEMSEICDRLALYNKHEHRSRDASTASHRPAHQRSTMKMPRPSPANLLLLLATSLLALPWPASCGNPVLIPVAKEPATSLYTILIRDGAPHLVDLAGPLLWSTCAADHLPAAFTCNSTACTDANAYRAPTCHIAGHHCKTTTTKCKAYPYNPITGKCAAANLVHTRLVANTTDGKTPLQQVSVRAVAACAPPSILASMPKDVTGVAGLSAAGLALPAQVAASQGVARKFLLCLPRRGEGVAIFGGGPLFLLPESSMGDLTTALAFTRLVTRKDNPLYYIPVEAIAVNNAPVTLPANVLAGGGGVVLCSRVSYTMLRPDVYRPVVDAFERALARSDAKVSAAAPFELCYKSSMLGNTRLGYAVPDVALVLEGGKSWTFTGSSSMVDVDGQTACFAFVEMKGVKSGDPSAAGAVVGGFQMEDHLLQFDIEKMQLGFAKVPFFSACSNFNFTKTQLHSSSSRPHQLGMPTMPRSKAARPLAVAFCLAVCTLAAAATAPNGGKPLVTPITKDASTSLYTSPLKATHPLVLDLSGPLIWTSTCPPKHPTLQCHHSDCAHAHSYHPPGCPRTGYGVADEEDRFRCKCTAHPYNPFAGDKSATGDLTRVTLSANATDGHNPLRPVSFTAVAACAPPSLLANLPAGAAGVAGLAASRVALPAQVAREEKVPDKFLLCLPRSSGDGVAIFGGGPLFLMTVTAPPVEVETDFASSLTYTPLLSRRGSSSYYLPVNAIAVDKEQVKLPAADTLAAGGVVLSTRAPYTALRPDVYRPFVDAFDKALKSQSNSKRVAAVAPFELCYDSKTLPGPTRIGWLVPDIVLVLDGGKTNWTFGGLNTMVDVNGFTAACFGFVEMKVKPEKKGGYGGAPAVEIGGFQMEDHVLQFDLEKRQLGFARTQRTGDGDRSLGGL
ncbi:hypothetical protein HU200_009488 [Digitaria exilis]|uniref:Peptidase A1 domain-containing protein n=1 Tax=Digitaria exilis TaxID=1010633 RepID=A0A835FKV8_9POAL|nr:hypothetical protein HU200_009488 [Digitaria exilis]